MTTKTPEVSAADIFTILDTAVKLTQRTRMDLATMEAYIKRFRRAQAVVADLIAENEVLQANAERYLWLRNNCTVSLLGRPGRH